MNSIRHAFITLLVLLPYAVSGYATETATKVRFGASEVGLIEAKALPTARNALISACLDAGMAVLQVDDWRVTCGRAVERDDALMNVLPGTRAEHERPVRVVVFDLRSDGDVIRLSIQRWINVKEHN